MFYKQKKSLSSFIHPHVILNLYYFISSVEHKRLMFEEYLDIRFKKVNEDYCCQAPKKHHQIFIKRMLVLFSKSFEAI